MDYSRRPPAQHENWIDRLYVDKVQLQSNHRSFGWLAIVKRRSPQIPALDMTCDCLDANLGRQLDVKKLRNIEPRDIEGTTPVSSSG